MANTRRSIPDHISKVCIEDKEWWLFHLQVLHDKHQQSLNHTQKKYQLFLAMLSLSLTYDAVGMEKFFILSLIQLAFLFKDVDPKDNITLREAFDNYSYSAEFKNELTVNRRHLDYIAEEFNLPNNYCTTHNLAYVLQLLKCAMLVNPDENFKNKFRHIHEDIEFSSVLRPRPVKFNFWQATIKPSALAKAQYQKTSNYSIFGLK